MLIFFNCTKYLPYIYDLFQTQILHFQNMKKKMCYLKKQVCYYRDFDV